MCADLESLIKVSEDGVMVVNLGLSELGRFVFIGHPPTMPDTGATIV
jgi:DUF438 domain-containing protein